jgi:hypothetical protein
MDQHNEGMLATWTGTAMTFLTALVAVAAVLYPQRPVLWGLAVFFAAGAILSFIQVARIRRRAAQRAALESQPKFTSDGLDWKTISSGVVHGRFMTQIKITPVKELPQPLVLRVTCSHVPSEIRGTFYSDHRNMDSNLHLPIRGRVDGQMAFVELKEPKLRPPAVLYVTAQMETEDEISINLVERQG